MAFTTFLSAAEHRVYLGCEGREKTPAGIFLSIFDSETGALQPPQRVATAGNPSFLAIDAGNKFLYSVSEAGDGSVVAWSIASDGTLTELNQQPAGGRGPCHLSLSPSSKTLLVANYTGGSLASFPVQPDGTIGERASFFQLTGTGPDASRQEAPHAHGIYTDPTGKWVYVPDLGTDKVWIYRLDEETSALTPNEPAFAVLPPGSGPRHLAFDLTGRHAYVNGEMGLNITAFTLNPQTGALNSASTAPVFPKELTLPKNADTAEVVVHPTNRFLYVSTRAYNSLSSFTIAADGSLTFLENLPLTVKGPRHFSISPNGRWMIVPGQRSHTVEVLQADPETGKLKPTGTSVELPGPVCAIFAPAK
jgi:6-phosphogluconolactonase